MDERKLLFCTFANRPKGHFHVHHPFFPDRKMPNLLLDDVKRVKGLLKATD